MNLNLQNQQIEINLQKLIALFENKTNYCNDLFIKNAKNSIQKYSQVIHNLFLNVEIFKENKNQTINFSKFTTKQIDNLELLANKISQLTEQFGENYYYSTAPILQQQPKSYAIQKFLGNNKDVNQLLVNYPVFETIDFNQNNLEFIKSNKDNSQKLILEKNVFGYIVKQPNSLVGQIFTIDKLDHNLNYIFRCKVNKYLNCSYIAFGIMKTQEIHTKYLYEEKCSFVSNYKEFGLDKVLKGNYLNELNREINYLEVRVNIQKKLVLFMDFPQYKNINKVDDSKIIQGQDYSFGIFFNTPGDDYNIEIETCLVDDKDLENFNPK